MATAYLVENRGVQSSGEGQSFGSVDRDGEDFSFRDRGEDLRGLFRMIEEVLTGLKVSAEMFARKQLRRPGSIPFPKAWLDCPRFFLSFSNGRTIGAGFCVILIADCGGAIKDAG